MADAPSNAQAIGPSTIIVFHPGSKNLRFGRASDPHPVTVLHAVARRRREASTTNPRLDLLIPIDSDKLQNKPPPEVESARLQLCHTLQTSLKSDGSPRYATPSTQIAAYNKRSKIEVLSESITPWKNDSEQDVIVGNDIIQLDPKGPFTVHFPWRRGQPNVGKGTGGSLTAVMADLECIWGRCLEKKLEIPVKELSNYQAVIVVPAMFDRVHASEMMNLALNRLGFGMAFLLQDHVAATFGSGLACATVVDVGDQKISVSCVEDGISYPHSRIELKYGGADLTFALHNLLSQCAVPFNVDLNCLWDVDFLGKLKERHCHFDLNRCGPEEQSIIWNKPGETTKQYNVLLGDELLIVPLSFFNPDLLRGSVRCRAVVNQRTSGGGGQVTLPDDPFDANFITETSRRGIKEADGDVDEEFVDENKDHHENLNEKPNKIDVDQLLGVEQAILQSIDSCAGDDLKRRLYSSVLVVGGGFKFKGLGPWLHNKISMNTPRSYKSDPQEVITEPKDGDPSYTSWKGASILSSLETANELWIKQTEWKSSGSRILREKSLFAL